MSSNQNIQPTIPVPLADGITLKFLLIPAGRFRMGQRCEEAVMRKKPVYRHLDVSRREEPVTEVEVPAFWMGETPVTQEQYRVMAEACLEELSAIRGNLGSEPSYYKDREDSPQRPVERVNFHEARVVASWLMGKMRDAGILPKGYVVDLPPEALWEYACRAGTETEYWSGDGEAALEEVGWFLGNAGGQTNRVGEKIKPNPWGLHDMHGHVYEWCRDACWKADYRTLLEGAEAPWSEEMPEEDTHNRVLRGGSWDVAARDCSSAYSCVGGPDYRDWDGGFRLCVFPGPVKQAPEAKEEAEPAAVAEVVDVQDLNTNFPPRSGGEIFSDES